MASLALGPPTVADGRVFIGLNTGKVEAFSASTGHPLWIQSTGAYYVEVAPAVAGGMVFAGDTSGVLHAYDEATGSSVWTFQVPGSYPSIAASPAVWRGVLYQGAQNGVLLLLPTIWPRSLIADALLRSPPGSVPRSRICPFSHTNACVAPPAVWLYPTTWP